MQRGFLTVVSPIQDGANKALKPVRDLFGWFGDTLHAKSQRDELRKQVDKLRREADRRRRPKNAPTANCSTLYHLDNQLSVDDYHPVTATVVGQVAEHLVLDGHDRQGRLARACASTTR